MRTLKKYWAVLMLTFLAFGQAGTEKAMAQGGTMVTFQTFYDELSPYGRWINYPGHGYVWSPDVEPGFQPYATRGHWVMTEYGNTWVSDYPWGWAPFHYGRWLWDDFMGWVWVPGAEWGPAWVNWRSGADYYGWAPLGPGMHINVMVNIPMAHWIFVPRRHIMSRRVYNYCLPRTRVVNVYHNTTIINNYYRNDNRTYVYGPRVQEIQQHTRSRVPVYRVNQDSRPGQVVVDKGTVRMYRPNITAQRNEAPARVDSRESISRPERAGTSNGSNYQERSDRSSYSENRANLRAGSAAAEGNTPVRERNSESRSSTVRESSTEGRSNVTRESNLPGRSSTGRESRPEIRENTTRESYPGGRLNTTGPENTRTREAARSTVARPETGNAAPYQGRTIREQSARTQAPAERPAAPQAPARRELSQPARSTPNPAVRQEQAVSRPVQRSEAGYTPRVREQSSQSQPRRPQRGATERQPGN